MKKMLVVILTVIILYNAILPNLFCKVSAVDELTLPINAHYNEIMGGENYAGNSNIVFDNEQRPNTKTDSQDSSMLTIFFDAINIIPIVCTTLMSIAAYPEDNSESVLNGGEVIVDSVDRWFSISDTVFGRVGLFNINYAEESEGTPALSQNNLQTSQGSEQVGQTLDEGTTITNVIKQNVAKWYMAIRNLTIVILLLILIYIGIRMVTSSLASQKSAYKKMLMNWVVSLALVFILHYIIFFAIGLSEALGNVLQTASVGIIGQNGEKNIEQELLAGTKLDEEDEDLYQDGKVLVARTGLIESLTATNGVNIIYLSILLWVLVFYQLKFFFLYLKRFLTVGFLIVIAPIITITYSIDKAGDGKAQAFSAWLKEFLVNVFIQPLHAILYLIFMSAAYEIVFLAPILAIAFLAGLSRGEKIVKELLHIRGLTSIHSMSETMGMKLFKSK